MTEERLKQVLQELWQTKRPSRQITIRTGRGGMNLIEEAFRDQGFSTPYMNCYVIEQDFPGEPKILI